MTHREPIYLIVNADDYGYFPCISRGIIDAASSGSVTATGILANTPDLKTQLEWLDSVDRLDLGVHLNLTFGKPLSENMTETLSRWHGCFPGMYWMSLMILAGKITIQDVRVEWRAQIEACQYRKLQFLNSHEHIHILPVLFPLALELAQEYEIPHIRITEADWTGSGLIRNTLIQTMQLINRPRLKMFQPKFLGLSRSGKLDYCYLETIFSKLEPGKHYELMCHPGRFDASEISNSKLRHYHDWDAELALLQSSQVQALYKKFGIRLSNYQNHNN